ncbi:hypothetical protein H6P81_019757 [Aristolochia fimbriata]|uniref:Uncharacterized protein n=1 Tax=Aristolochia fimbriata TaxID=158543 RepID=A0AAV7DVU0_ARIFI|nr:hypothetical protein H6P81_019757 [Aristolochia fimbriata]
MLWITVGSQASSVSFVQWNIEGSVILYSLQVFLSKLEEIFDRWKEPRRLPFVGSLNCWIMGSSSRKRRKSSSSKDKRKKRRRDISLSDSEDYYSSSDTNKNYRKKRKLSKKTKKSSRCSPSCEDGNGHKRRSHSERRSRSVERKKPSKRRHEQSPSNDSCSTCSGRNSSSNDEIVHKNSLRSSHRFRQKVKNRRRRRSRYQSRSSRSCSSCRQCSVSSRENSPPHANPRIGMSKILKKQEPSNNSEDKAEADILQSNDGYPSSRSNDSNDAGRKEMQELGASTTISGNATKVEASFDVGDSSADDLEALLRQKALENFAKFRFRRLGSGKYIGNESDVSRSSESIRSEAYESSARVTGNLSDGIGVSLAVKGCRDSSAYQSPVVIEGAECTATLRSDEKRPGLISLSKNIPDGTVEISSSSVGGLEVEAVGGTALQECPSPEPKISNDTSHDGEVAGKSDSELKRKTMRVMRGGKLVQVGYELYIPKKYPALARRKFQT